MQHSELVKVMKWKLMVRTVHMFCAMASVIEIGPSKLPNLPSLVTLPHMSSNIGLPHPER